MDAGTYVAQATTTVLIAVKIAFTVTESLAAIVTFLESVAGNG